MRTFSIELDKRYKPCRVPVKYNNKVIGLAIIDGDYANITVTNDKMKQIIKKNHLLYMSSSVELEVYK